MIIVMPWGHAVPYAGSQSNNTATFERYLIEEVIPQVEKKYRVARGRENRAIVGLSMGGGHALQIGLSHLELFSAVAAFSSAVPGNIQSPNRLTSDALGARTRKVTRRSGCTSGETRVSTRGACAKAAAEVRSRKLMNAFIVHVHPNAIL